ncbi:MAG: low molecular weight protein-tyrosine-phosphatase [Crocinitomicaceae bacterium]
MKILMVCLGNICRSPLAEGIMLKKIKDLNLKMWVESAGTSGTHAGDAPDRRMQKTATMRGVDIGDLRAKKFKRKDFKKFDHIYVMDEDNYNNVIDIATTEVDKSKVKMILNELNPESNTPVPDPYYGGQDGFEIVFDLLDQATDKIIEKLR